MPALSASDFTHLLRRTGYGGPQTAGVTALTAELGPTPDRAAIVDRILDVSGSAGDPPPAELSQDIGDWKRVWRMTEWWLDRMTRAQIRLATRPPSPLPHPLQERMTFFWHGLFVSGEDKVDNARMMYDQNHLYRSEGLGAFEPLCQHMALDPAMLRYLDNDPNEVGSPNENFARELLELFTLGVNKYTQLDVSESARAWTGHNLDNQGRYQFYPSRHDNGPKQFMGITQNWDGPQIITHLCRSDAINPVTGEAPKRTLSRYIAQKVWSFFAYPNPDPTLTQALADVFLANGLSLSELVRAVLNRDEFYSPTARSSLVRTPVDFVVALQRATGLHAYPVAEPDPLLYEPWGLEDMGQLPFYPPNVAGWKQNSYWIATTAIWSRMGYAQGLRWLLRNDDPALAFLGNTADSLRDANGSMQRDPANNDQYRHTMTVPQAVQAAFDAFGIDAPSANTRAQLEAWLTAQRVAEGRPGAGLGEWAWWQWGYLNLIVLTVLTPEFQLA